MEHVTRFTLDALVSGRWFSIADRGVPGWQLKDFRVLSIAHRSLAPDDNICVEFTTLPDEPQKKHFTFFLDHENVVIGRMEVNLATQRIYWAHGYASQAWDYYTKYAREHGHPIKLGDGPNRLQFDVDVELVQVKATNAMPKDEWV